MTIIEAIQYSINNSDIDCYLIISCNMEYWTKTVHSYVNQMRPSTVEYKKNRILLSNGSDIRIVRTDKGIRSNSNTIIGKA